jgi:hypothetical protein
VLEDYTPASGLILDVLVWPQRETCKTDSTGRFAFLLDSDEARRLAWERTIQIRERTTAGIEIRGAACPLPDQFSPGEIHVGTIMLQDAQTLVSGWIRGDTGPVKEPVLEGSRGQEILLDQGGRFQVRGVPFDSTVNLTARARSCAQREMYDVPVGTRNLDILLRTVGRVTVEIRVDPPVIELHSAMRFELIDEAGTRRGAAVSTTETGWECSWYELPPGTYRLVVRPFVAARPLAEVQGILVGNDDFTEEAPLSLDLRGRLRRIRLSLRDLNGDVVAPDSGVVVSLAEIFQSQEKRFREAMRIYRDRFDIPVASETIAVRVDAGALAGTYVGPSVDATVTMRPQSTMVHIEGLPEAPDNAYWSLRAIARNGEGTVKLRYFVGEDLVNPDQAFLWEVIGAVGPCSLTLAPNTRYSLKLLFHSGRGRHRSRRSIDIAPGMIDVGISPPSRITLQVNRDAVARAVR